MTVFLKLESSQILIDFFFYVCLSMCGFVKGSTSRPKRAHCFCLVCSYFILHLVCFYFCYNTDCNIFQGHNIVCMAAVKQSCQILKNVWCSQGRTWMHTVTRSLALTPAYLSKGWSCFCMLIHSDLFGVLHGAYIKMYIFAIAVNRLQCYSVDYFTHTSCFWDQYFSLIACIDRRITLHVFHFPRFGFN